jgi:hypothetical protein
MRNLLAFLGAVTLTVVGLGWYLGWYQVKSEPAPNGHRGVSIDINTVKIGADIKKGSEKLETIIEKKGQDQPATIPGPNPAVSPLAPAPGNKPGLPAPNVDGSINFNAFRASEMPPSPPADFSGYKY